MRRAGLIGQLFLLAACPGDLPFRGDLRTVDSSGAPQDLGAKDQSLPKEQGVAPGKEQGVIPKDQAVTPGKDQSVTPAGGLGARCSSTKPCADPYGCLITKLTATDGFCTKECPLADFGGKPCSGGLPGTGYFCIFGDHPTAPKQAFCGFLCKAKDSSGKITTWPCPPELTCGASSDGLAVCE